MHNEKFCIAVVTTLLLSGCTSSNTAKYSQSNPSSDSSKISPDTEKSVKDAVSETKTKRINAIIY